MSKIKPIIGTNETDANCPATRELKKHVQLGPLLWAVLFGKDLIRGCVTYGVQNAFVFCVVLPQRGEFMPLYRSEV